MKEALVVSRDKLFKEKYFQGFLPINEHDFTNSILTNFDYHPRGDDLENNSDLQQIIPYVWLINPQTKKIFAYKRATDPSKYSEKRLQNKWSCGVGGHIERIDSENPIDSAMMRELMEEVSIAKFPKPKMFGYINEEETSVGKVHFGVVAIAETTLPIEKGDDEMTECEMLSIAELEQLFKSPENEIESWTQVSWPAVKKYVENL